MSCQIRPTAVISDVPTVRRSLFPTDDLRGGDTWLQTCKISVSPTGDIIVIANHKRIVVLMSSWDSKSNISHFHVTFSGVLEENDVINSVLCLPIVGVNNSSQVGPDWICIAIGYESGFVRFYAENCSLLFEEQLHNESVMSIKCQSQHSPRPDISTEIKPEELYVHYASNVCVINGANLFSSLRDCRSHLAKVQALGNTQEPFQISMNPKKWGFTEQSSINDSVVVGLDLLNTFDHLLTASVCGGFDTKYRSMAPHNNLILAAGTKPFVGFHYGLEGGQQPVLSDVAKTVANKLKSALPSWLTGGKTQVEKQQTLIFQPAELMGCRFGLCDLRRSAQNIILSPDRKIASVCDALGRISLIDVHKGIIIRLFKGYRDAQCSFIQVPDERKPKHRSQRRVALFFIIYSSKKGTLEIFSAQQGIKIATFTASKYSRLIYINYGLMGFTTTSKSKYVCSFTCVFVDNDGQIKEIVVPFHFVLTEKNSKRARDIHLYKRLKHFIKSSEYDLEKLEAETYNTCLEIKSTEVKMQCVEMLVSSKEVPSFVLNKCIDYFLEKISIIEENELDNDTKQFRVVLENLRALIKFYECCNKTELDEINGNLEEPQGTTSTLSFKEMSNLQKLLDLSIGDTMKNDLKVSFHDGNDYSISEFLNMFNLKNQGVITLKNKLEEVILYKGAKNIYGRYIKDGLMDCSGFQMLVKMSRIAIKDLFNLLLLYWVRKPLNIDVNLEKEMNNLVSVIYSLTKSGKSEVNVEYNTTSPFWTDVRESLKNSARPFPALMAAILCRTVAQRIEQEKEMEQSGVSLEEDMEIWEKLSQENIQWNLLIGKLEDVSLLNIILTNKLDGIREEMPKLIHEKIDISLKYVLQSGKGCVSELVAKWLTSVGINPKYIRLNELMKTQENSEEINFTEEEIYQLEQPLFNNLNILKQQFPYSLDVSVLLANMCWEYVLSWQKDIQNITKLEAALKCIDEIPNPHMKQGVFNLVWNTHLKLLFESCCKLINKVGKLPKERLCKQDTNLLDHQLVIFISLCTNFFDSFMDTVQQCCNTPKIQLSFEPIWENGSQQSLVELTLTQDNINYDLLHLHYQLSLCMQMITSCNVKFPKLIQNLFDYSLITLFFTDFQNKTQINWNKTDTKVNMARTQFLMKVIISSIETVTVVDNKIYSTDHVNWMSKCVTMARVWNLDVDALKRFQIVNLYNSGFDVLAEELLPSVNELDKIGGELLMVCGRRLKKYLISTQNLAEKITAFSPGLTTYLEKLNDEWCAPTSLESILTLVTLCLRCLNENQSDYKLACLMLDTCSNLEDIKRQ